MSKKRKIYTALEVFFAVLLVIAVIRLAYIGYNYYKGDQIYDNAVAEYVEENPNPVADGQTTIDLGFQVDFKKLYKTNEEIIGWIYIPDTPVNYPLLYTDNNSYYLKHTYEKEYSDFGSIFLATECSSDFSDTHSLIYGHNTKNNSMFGSLKKYKDSAYLKEHPYFYIVQDDRVLEYKIVSAFTAETSDDIYLLTFEDDPAFITWLQNVEQLSVVDCSAPEVTGKEKVVTLSTCTSRTKTERFVVNGILENTYDALA